MKRGQAFETMMLVISVIVALAILGVLTGILGGLQVGIASSPDQAVHDQLKQITSSGYGYSTPQKAVLKKGSRLDLKSIVKNDLPELRSDGSNVKICINTVQLPTSGTTVVLPNGGTACTFAGTGTTRAYNSGTGTLTIGPTTQDVSFYFVVCGDSGLGGNGLYRIQISGTSQSAASDCTF